MKALICKLFHKYYTKSVKKIRLEDNTVIVKESRECIQCSRIKSKLRREE